MGGEVGSRKGVGKRKERRNICIIIQFIYIK